MRQYSVLFVCMGNICRSPTADGVFRLTHDSTVVPDPYYDGPSAFEHVLDLVEDACNGLMQHVRMAATDRRSRVNLL
jgi:protein-tyrosine-phosphatase